MDDVSIATGTKERLRVKTWENNSGRRFVAIAPEFKDQGGLWRLAHSGLVITPDVCRELAAAILAFAADIEAAPVTMAEAVDAPVEDEG